MLVEVLFNTFECYHIYMAFYLEENILFWNWLMQQYESKQKLMSSCEQHVEAARVCFCRPPRSLMYMLLAKAFLCMLSFAIQGRVTNDNSRTFQEQFSNTPLNTVLIWSGILTRWKFKRSEFISCLLAFSATFSIRVNKYTVQIVCNKVHIKTGIKLRTKWQNVLENRKLPNNLVTLFQWQNISRTIQENQEIQIPLTTFKHNCKHVLTQIQTDALQPTVDLVGDNSRKIFLLSQLSQRQNKSEVLGLWDIRCQKQLQKYCKKPRCTHGGGFQSWRTVFYRFI